jgi:dolichol kinase
MQAGHPPDAAGRRRRQAWPMNIDPVFWLSEGVQVGSLAGVAYVSGKLVQNVDLKVNYARKISFFAIFLVPFALRGLFHYGHNPLILPIKLVVGVSMFAFLAGPIRTRVPAFATMFRSFDRPEDRPHTLFWLTTQILAGYAVLVPMSFVFASRGLSDLLLVPVLIHGIGDGLAEPVGTRWGRHTYRTSGFLTRDRKFTRSFEGSACVFAAGLLAVLLFHSSFSPPELVACLLVVPLASTLAEARAPHTWDTPYMFLASTVSLLAITTLV